MKGKGRGTLPIPSVSPKGERGSKWRKGKGYRGRGCNGEEGKAVSPFSSQAERMGGGSEGRGREHRERGCGMGGEVKREQCQVPIFSQGREKGGAERREGRAGKYRVTEKISCKWRKLTGYSGKGRVGRQRKEEDYHLSLLVPREEKRKIMSEKMAKREHRGRKLDVKGREGKRSTVTPVSCTHYITPPRLTSLPHHSTALV